MISTLTSLSGKQCPIQRIKICQFSSSIDDPITPERLLTTKIQIAQQFTCLLILHSCLSLNKTSAKRWGQGHVTSCLCVTGEGAESCVMDAMRSIVAGIMHWRQFTRSFTDTLYGSVRLVALPVPAERRSGLLLQCSSKAEDRVYVLQFT